VQIGEGSAKGPQSKGSPPGPDEEDDTVAASLRFVEIRGLYRPGYDDGTRRDDGSGYGCGYEVGYTSSDGRGRVFVNHRPRASASEPWADVRAKDVQYIEMIVQVQTTGSLPAGVEVEWTWEDPDDPSDASMHAAASRHIDPNGTRGNDNQGTCDYGPARGSRRPAFEAVSGFAMSGSGSTCRTAISSNESRVRLHLTNSGGDNFRVEARLVGGLGSSIVTSGVMTMWKRIDVEYHQMQQVWIVPVAEVVRGLEAAFVQLDFTRPIDLAHRSWLTRGPNYEAASTVFTNGLFRHAHEPGWFLLVAADLESRLSVTNSRRTAYTGQGWLYSFSGAEWLVIGVPLVDERGRATTAASVKLRNGSQTLTFAVTGTARGWPSPGYTAIQLRPLTYYNVIEPNTGAALHAHSGSNEYLPLRHLGFSTEVDCEVSIGFEKGAYGISPTIRRRGIEYFCGRTIAFMGRFNSADESAQTIVHELCHDFGFAHACGRPSAQASSQYACAMAIVDHWVFRRGSGTLDRWRSPPRRTEFCEYHLRGLRQTHLEDNEALWTWP
jgi:hypothetical protein